MLYDGSTKTNDFSIYCIDVNIAHVLLNYNFLIIFSVPEFLGVEDVEQMNLTEILTVESSMEEKERTYVN